MASDEMLREWKDRAHVLERELAVAREANAAAMETLGRVVQERDEARASLQEQECINERKYDTIAERDAELAAVRRERDEAYGRIVVLRRQLDDAETRLEIAGGSIAMLQDDAPDDPMADLAESARRLVRLVSLMADVQIAKAPGSVQQGRWVAEHREMRREWEES